jgi:hypothetical protein
VLLPRNVGDSAKLIGVIVPAPQAKLGGEIRWLAIENGSKNNGHSMQVPPQRVARAMGIPVDRQNFDANDRAVTNRLPSRLVRRYEDSVTRIAAKPCSAF